MVALTLGRPRLTPPFPAINAAAHRRQRKFNMPLKHTPTSVSKAIRVWACAAGASLVLALPTAQAQSLVELYEAARSYDATFLAARAQFEADQAKADQGRAAWRPQVGISAGKSRTETDGSPTTKTDSSNITLSATQPIIRAANFIGAAQSEKSRAVAQAKLTAAEQELIVRSARTYFDVLAARDNLAFVRAQKEAVEQQLASAKRNFEVGTSTITDQREAQARFDLVVAQEIAADNNLQIKTLALKQLVGRDDISPWQLNAETKLPQLEAKPLETWLQEAQELSPQIQQAEVGFSIAKLETRKAQASHLPTLDLVASKERSRLGEGGASTTRRPDTTTIGVRFNMPLYSGGATQSSVYEALALEDKSRNDLEGARRAVTQLTREAYLGLIAGQGQVRALEAAESSSESALEANRLGYQVGVRINIDVLNAQSQLFETKAKLAQARFDYLVGTLRLKQAVGTLTPQDLEPINALLKP
jgi:outer membrane protein